MNKILLLFNIEINFQGKFPIATNDKITRIYVLLKDINNNCRSYLLTTLDIHGTVNNLEIIKYSNEKELIFGFGNLIKSSNPNIISGYYVSSFDFNYIRDRLLFYGEEIEKQFRLDNDLTWKIYIHRGFQQYYQYKNSEMIDLHIEVMLKHKLKNYSLNKVLKYLLNIDFHKTNTETINCVFAETHELTGFDAIDKTSIITEEFELLLNNFKLFNLFYNENLLN